MDTIRIDRATVIIHFGKSWTKNVDKVWFINIVILQQKCQNMIQVVLVGWCGSLLEPKRENSGLLELILRSNSMRVPSGPHSPAKGKQKLAPLRLFPPCYSFLKILHFMLISPGLYTFQFDCGDLLGQLLDQSRGCSCEGESRMNSTLVELGLLSPISIQDK